MLGPRIYTITDYGAVSNDQTVDVADAFEAIFEEIDADPRSGGAIFVPPGTYTLRRPVVFRHDFLTVCGFAPGFATGTGEGGGSRILVRADTGFVAPRRPGAPRVNSLAFCDLILDGGVAGEGRRGIAIEQDSDAVVVQNVALKEFGEALVLRAADAASILGNIILENDSCLRLVESGKAVVVANNRLGGKPAGITAFCEGQERMVFEGNNVFPDGYANVVLKNSRHCVISGNQLQSYYIGALHLEGSCEHNNVSGNTILSERSPAGAWNENPAAPRPDDFGLVRVEGRDNLLASNAITSDATRGHVMVAIEGEGTRVADQMLVARGAAATKIAARGGTAARPTVIVHSARPDELEVAAGAVVATTPLPTRGFSVA